MQMNFYNRYQLKVVQIGRLIYDYVRQISQKRTIQEVVESHPRTGFPVAIEDDGK